MSPFRRVLSACLAVAAITASLSQPASAHVKGGACKGAMGQYVDSFLVETEWNKKVYRPREVVKVLVTVTRPGPNDPATGEPWPTPPPPQPAAGVNVTSTFVEGFPYPYGVGITDANGQVNLKIKLAKDSKGEVDTYTRAWLVQNQNGPACTEFTEQGYKQETPAFMVKG